MPPVDYTYVYVMTGINDPSRHYTGCTRDVTARLESHNSGANPYTAKYRPWQIEVCVAFKHQTKARAFEKYLKSGSGREFSRRHF